MSSQVSNKRRGRAFRVTFGSTLVDTMLGTESLVGYKRNQMWSRKTII